MRKKLASIPWRSLLMSGAALATMLLPQAPSGSRTE